MDSGANPNIKRNWYHQRMFIKSTLSQSREECIHHIVTEMYNSVRSCYVIQLTLSFLEQMEFTISIEMY